MSFTPQPYPLFIGRWDDTRIEIGRIICWYSPPSARMDTTHIQPVVSFSKPNGSATEPKLAHLSYEDDEHWIGASVADVRAMMKMADD